MARRGKRHRLEQIARELQNADAMLAAGKTIGEVCRALRISEQTLHRWRNQYESRRAEDVGQLKELTEQKRRLKRRLIEVELEIILLRDAGERLKTNESCTSPGRDARTAAEGAVSRRWKCKRNWATASAAALSVATVGCLFLVSFVPRL